MSDRGEFEHWADEFDHNSDMWEDMGRDEIFMAGMRAARAQGGEPLAWVSEDSTEKQLVSGKARRLWWENKTGVGIPIYTNPQPAQQTRVPDGWKLVPEIPTGPMLDAWFCAPRDGLSEDTNWYPAYKAMLSAAPAAPQSSKGEPKP